MIRRALHSLLGSLSLEERVERLNPTAWFDATETYAKSKIAWSTAVSDTGLVSTQQSFSASDGAGGDRAFTAIWTGEYNGNGHIFGAVGETASNEWGWSVTVNGNIRVFLIDSWTGTTGYLAFRDSVNLTTGRFYQIALVYDGTGATNGLSSLKLYVTDVLSDTSSQLLLDGSTPATYVDISSGTYSAANTYGNLNVTRGDPATIQSGVNNKNDQTIFLDKALSETELNEILNYSATDSQCNGLNHKDLDGTETFYNNIVAWYDFNVPKNFGRNYAEESHAVNCDGTSGYLTAQSSTAFNYGNVTTDSAFSAGVWVNFDFISTGGGHQPLMVKGNEWYFYQQSQATPRIAVAFEDSTSGLFTKYILAAFNVTGRIAINEWHLIGFSYNGNGLSSGITLYLDGSPITPDVTADVSYTAMGQKSIALQLMGHTLTNELSGSPVYTNGKIDEGFVYSDELSAGEWTTLYNSGTVAEASTLHSDNLVSSWSFNEQDPALVGGDVYGSNDLTPTSIVEADLVGGKDSLDLTEVSITSANTATGHIEGKAAGYDGLTKVTDRSGNGNNGVQLTLAEVGTWFTDNYMRFTGNDNLDTSSNIDLSGDFTIVMRCRQSDVTESCDLLATSTTILNNNASGRNVVLGVTSTTAMTNNVWQNLSIKSDGGTISFRLNGTADGSGSRDATVVSSAILQISDTTMTQNFDLRGFFVAQTAIADNDIKNIEDYFITLDP